MFLSDLQLCPAALVHFASRVTTGEDTDYLLEDLLQQVNIFAAGEMRGKA